MKAFSFLFRLVTASLALSAANPVHCQSFRQHSFELSGTRFVLASVGQLVDYPDPPSAPVVRNPELEAVADDILHRLVQALPPENAVVPRFRLVDDGGYNCSVDYGSIAVYCSYQVVAVLSRAGVRGRDQLAFLLAHELAHTSLARHRTELKRANGATELIDVATPFLVSKLLSGKANCGGADNEARNALNEIIATMSEQLILPRWIRGLEDEADSFGLLLMQKAGYNPSEAPQVLSSLGEDMARARRAGRDGRVVGSSLLGMIIASCRSDKLDIRGLGIGLLAGFAMGHLLETPFASEHRSALKRAKRLSTLIESAFGDMAADEGSALFAELEAQPAPLLTSPVLVAGSGANSANRWDMALSDLTGQFEQLVRSKTISELLVRGKAVDAVKLCPPEPGLARLAIKCGLAYADLEKGDVARRLFALGLGDENANYAAYRRIADGHVRLGEVDLALDILSQGEARFGPGPFVVREVEIRMLGGDREGAKRTVERCRAINIEKLGEACAFALENPPRT